VSRQISLNRQPLGCQPLDRQPLDFAFAGMTNLGLMTVISRHTS